MILDPENILTINGDVYIHGIKQEEPPAPPPVQEWWWLYPDQFYGSIRECANPSLWEQVLIWLGLRASGCPAVVRFGTANNPEYSHSVKLTEAWQHFQADLLSLAEYGVHTWALDDAEYENIAQAWRSTYGPRRALTNVPDARQDFVSRPPRDLDKEARVYDQIRGMATNSYQGTIEKNSHNQTVLRIRAFDWASGPPSDYGLDILYHPCVQYGTIQYGGGAVGGWPQLTAQVPVPLIAREPIYCLAYKFERYVGERREVGYTPPPP